MFLQDCPSNNLNSIRSRWLLLPHRERMGLLRWWHISVPCPKWALSQTPQSPFTCRLFDFCRKENYCPYNQLISNFSRIGREDLTVLLTALPTRPSLKLRSKQQGVSTIQAWWGPTRGLYLTTHGWSTDRASASPLAPLSAGNLYSTAPWVFPSTL